MALAEAIASQQLSTKAADTIFGRFCGLFGPDGVPEPVRLLQFDARHWQGAVNEGNERSSPATFYLIVAVSTTAARISISAATTGVGGAAASAIARPIIIVEGTG